MTQAQVTVYYKDCPEDTFCIDYRYGSSSIKEYKNWIEFQALEGKIRVPLKNVRYHRVIILDEDYLEKMEQEANEFTKQSMGV